MMGFEVGGTQNTAVKVQLGELSLQDVDKSGPTNCEEFIYVDISSVDRETKKIIDAKRLPTTEAPSRAKQILRTGDVIVSMTRPNLNAVAKITSDLDGAIGSTGFHVIRSRYIEPGFAYYLVQTREFVEAMCKCVQGALYPAVRPSDISSFEFLLRPQLEQQRIVTKIEELFSELDKSVENLRTSQQQLKVYRQALLKHAFEGKLTADWRVQNPDKLESADALLGHIQQERDGRYQQLLQDWQAAQKEWEEKGKVGSKPSKPKAQKVLPPLTVEELAELPELPKSWAWARVLDACAEVVDCHNKTAPYQSSGIPLVRTPSIRNMKLNFDDSIRYVSSETYQFWSRRCPPEPGDILFTREAPMGEAAIIPEGKKVCMGQRIMLLRTYKELLVGKYLLAATQAPAFKRYSNKLAVGTGVKHLRVGDVERLIFPICPINEQIKIVENLDAQFSQLDQLEQTITHSLQQAEALRQSILKKAFSGQLVPQDPNDEPASMLLERIRAERAAQLKARGRKAKA